MCAVYVGCSVCDCVCQEEGGRGRREAKKAATQLSSLVDLFGGILLTQSVDRQTETVCSIQPAHLHAIHCRPHTAAKIFASNFLANKCGVSTSAEIELLQLKYIEWEKGGCC